MSVPAKNPSLEFRPYRRFLSWCVWGLAAIGSAYLLTSVGVTIYRRRHPEPVAASAAPPATPDELASCHEELTEVLDGLEKHLESFHTLLGHYDAEEAQRWAEGGVEWRAAWMAAGKRCRFDQRSGGKLSKELESMAAAHAEMMDIDSSYSRELERFGREQAPRLDRVREQMSRIRTRLNLPPSSERELQ